MFCDKEKASWKVRLFLLGLIPLCLFVWSGCSLFGGGDGVKHASGIRVRRPQGWKKIKHKGSDVAYRLPTGNLVTLTSSCNRHSNAPLNVLTKHLLFGLREVSFLRQEKIAVGGKVGLHSSVKAKLEGKPLLFEFFVISKRGCIFDFTLMSPKKIPSKELGQFIAFVKSFNYAKK